MSATCNDDPALLMEPVTAWRVWHATIVAKRWRLHSVLLPDVPVIWEPHQPLIARHVDTGDHTVNCSCGESPCIGDGVWSWGCGIYGLKRSLTAVLSDRAASSLPHAHHSVTIIGAVWLWGRIVEHAFGYRAQFGYPKAIYDCGLTADAGGPFGKLQQTTRGVREIADAYGIPIIATPLFHTDSVASLGGEA